MVLGDSSDDEVVEKYKKKTVPVPSPQIDPDEDERRMEVDALREKKRKDREAERLKEDNPPDLKAFMAKYEEERKKQKRKDKLLKEQLDDISGKLKNFVSYDYVAQNKDDMHELVTKQIKQYVDDLHKSIDDKYTSLRPYTESKTDTKSQINIDDAALEEKILKLLEDVIEKRIETQVMAIQQNKSKMELTEKRMKGIEDAREAIKQNQMRYDGEDKSYKLRMDRFEHQIKDVRDNLLDKLNSIFGAEHNVEDLLDRYKEIRDDITRRIEEIESKNQTVLQDVDTVRQATKQCADHIDVFTNTYEEIRESVNGMESRVTDVQRRVLESGHLVSNFQREVRTEMTGMKQGLDQHRSSLELELGKIRENITSFDNVILKHNSSMEGLERELKGLGDKVKELQSQHMKVERGSMDAARILSEIVGLQNKLEVYIDEKVQDVEARHAVDKSKLDGLQAEYVELYKNIQDVSRECKKDYRSTMQQNDNNNSALRTELDNKYTKLAFQVKELADQLKRNISQNAGKGSSTGATPGVRSTDTSSIQRDMRGLQARVDAFDGDLKTILTGSRDIVLQR